MSKKKRSLDLEFGNRRISVFLRWMEIDLEIKSLLVMTLGLAK